MQWKMKDKKASKSYKTIRLPDDYIKEISEIAEEHGASFNSVVVSMIETCLGKNGRKK